MAHVLGMQVLQLNTTGRTSGEHRRVLLTTLDADADAGGWLVVASNLGADIDPNWWLNLAAADGRGSVTIGGNTVPVVAEALTGTARSAADQRVVDTFADYDTYRHQTSREIRVVHLKP